MLGNLSFYNAPGLVLSLRITEYRTFQAGILSQKAEVGGFLPIPENRFTEIDLGEWAGLDDPQRSSFPTFSICFPQCLILGLPGLLGKPRSPGIPGCEGVPILGEG